MGLKNFVSTLLFIGTLFVINVGPVISSNETQTHTLSSTNITLDTNNGTIECQCVKDDSQILKFSERGGLGTNEKVGNCKTKSWAFKYGQKWCYVDLPSNCTDLKNSTSEPNKKYSAQACSGKGPLNMHNICKL